MTMKISAIIPTMNRPADLKSALDSLMRQTVLPFEIVVVDQSTNNQSKIVVAETKQAHESKPVRFKYVVQEEKSLVKARNRGLDESEGDLLSFLDDDIVLFDDYYEKIVPHFEKDASLGALAGNTVVKMKLGGFKWFLRRMVMRIFLVNFFDGRMTPSGFGYPIYEREIDRKTEVEFLPGCNMNYRRSAIGSERFDEWFTGYSFREDVDYSYRVARRSKAVMIPEARLFHNYSVSNRMDFEALKKMEARNYHHVFAKHKGRSLFARILFAYSMLGLVLLDLLEFLTSWKAVKFLKFRAAVGSSLNLMLGRS
jgi:glycosyltransferase involved in cell wall biosynthesis